VKTTDRRTAIAALAAAGMLWGLSVPLSKLALEWLAPAWLTVVRFGVAAPLLAAVAGRRELRRAAGRQVLLSGAVGFGVVILVQNVGIERTSVSHAALIVGAVPALVALIAAALGRGTAGRGAWIGFALALAGVGLVGGSGGSGATAAGDALVLGSAVLSAAFIVAQPRLLAGRDPVAVTAVQLAAGAALALPEALLVEGAPAGPQGVAVVAGTAGLALGGTLVAFALFAFGQARTSPELAGAFVNLEPLVGAAAGAIAFHDAFGAAQLLGAAAVVIGIALSTLPDRRERLPAGLASGGDALAAGRRAADAGSRRLRGDEASAGRGAGVRGHERPAQVRRAHAEPGGAPHPEAGRGGAGGLPAERRAVRGAARREGATDARGGPRRRSAADRRRPPCGDPPRQAGRPLAHLGAGGVRGWRWESATVAHGDCAPRSPGTGPESWVMGAGT
jgi:drug/metabolite transporter (DMT)-like permease